VPSFSTVTSIDDECSIDDSTNNFDTISSKSIETRTTYTNESPKVPSIFDVSEIEN